MVTVEIRILLWLLFPFALAVVRPTSRPVSTLLIDNYDSYTYNLFQLLSEINGIDPQVVYNDEFRTWGELRASHPEFDNVVLSPGPGTPANPADFGLCMDTIKNSDVPLLGVCLGHQGMAYAHGGTVARAPEPMHGRLSPISHSDRGIFRGIEQEAKVVRYHSLLAYDLENCADLEETAWTTDAKGRKLLMGLQHKTKPQFGVQFHPESIGSACGRHLLSNFRDITLSWRDTAVVGEHKHRRQLIPQSDRKSPTVHPPAPSSPLTTGAVRTPDANLPAPLHVHVHQTSLPPNISSTTVSEILFDKLFSSSSASFWLDSAFPNNQSGLPLTQAPMLSFLGSLDGDGDGDGESFSVEYLGGNRLVRRRNELHKDAASGSSIMRPVFDEERKNIFEFLQSHVEEAKGLQVTLTRSGAREDPKELPFDITGTLFGYLGYEARHDAAHIQQHSLMLNATHDGSFVKSRFSASLPHPTSLFLSPSKYLVIDHDNSLLYCISSSRQGNGVAQGRGLELFQRALNALGTLQDMPPKSASHKQGETTKKSPPLTQLPSLRGGPGWAVYQKSIEKCLDYIRQGETYEVCLTTQFEGKLPPDSTAVELYKTLRKHNPAPYACFLRYDPMQHFSVGRGALAGIDWYRPGGLALCCSSPERFIKSTADGLVESKPIKGTMRRILDDPKADFATRERLATDEKSQAENLMIVDLVRNDLGRVAEVGSVHVPGLMKVESFKTVHHMVSTVRAKLRRKFSIVDALIATFPGGSMTGAPKIRTMGIIQDIEKRGRGVYSGAIGYICRSGASDFNIAIRTAVISGKDDIAVSSGGAIIALSDPASEMDEALLKAQAVSRAIGFSLCSQDECDVAVD